MQRTPIASDSRFEQALSIHSNNSGPLGISTIAARINLASLNAAQNNPEEAERLLMQQRDQVIDTFGIKALSVFRLHIIIGRAAESYNRIGRHEDAIRLKRMHRDYLSQVVSLPDATAAEFAAAALKHSNPAFPELHDLDNAKTWIEQAIQLEEKVQGKKIEDYRKEQTRINALPM